MGQLRFGFAVLLFIGSSSCLLADHISFPADGDGPSSSADVPDAAPQRQYHQVYVPSGPTRAQIAAQQRHQQSMAANDAGLTDYAKGNAAAAEAEFQQSLDLEPGDPVVTNNLAMAKNWLGMDAYDKGDYSTALEYVEKAAAIQQGLQDQTKAKFNNVVVADLQKIRTALAEKQKEKDEEEQQQQQQVADADAMKNTIANMTTSFSATGNTPGNLNAVSAVPDNGTSANGLSFMGSDPSVVDARTAPAGQSASAAGQTTTTGAFGANLANPTLIPAGPSLSLATDTRAGSQIKSAAATATNGGDLTKNYDVGNADPDGSLVYPTSHSVDLSSFSERARSDPMIQATVKQLDALQVNRLQLEKQCVELTKQRDAATDKDQMEKLTQQLDQKNKDYQDNQLSIFTQTQVMEKRHREVDATVDNLAVKK